MFLIRIALIGLFLMASAAGQGSGKGSQDDFITEVIQSLDKTNILRNALERGDRGDGIHYPWMDKMKKFRIKQISLAIDFEWRDNNVGGISVKTIDYHPQYYKYSDVIKESRVLDKVKATDLESSAKNEAIRRGRALLLKVLNGKPDATGTVYVNLLDDERLPVLNDMPDIDFSQKSGPGEHKVSLKSKTWLWPALLRYFYL